MRRRTKAKLATNKASARATSGGPSEEERLRSLEERVQDTLTETQVTGVSGMDTLNTCEGVLGNWMYRCLLCKIANLTLNMSGDRVTGKSQQPLPPSAGRKLKLKN
ncbi:hypothetical protein SKAU_G00374380 [Synaphobranchus kaupii]|uniref:Uncharacterized protein n=1 Tax=Synaphobranchus kaupii TaxID=118154 RepID=A0A9Q1EGP5_SYNKA|nr:hypothetical protein SKAU_G00374380 [Synaphobranchus kaupii]